MEKPRLIGQSKRQGTKQGISLFPVLFLLFFSCNSKPKYMEHRASVKGILQDQSGNPVSDAIIMITEGPQEFNDVASVSNQKGEFYLSNIVIPGRYVIQIQSDRGSIKKEVHVQDSQTTIRARL